MTNNGTCIYANTNLSLTLVSELDNDLDEVSGLAYIDNQVWTHNDSGSGDEVYVVDPIIGEVVQQVIIANADNVDWEDLAEDDQFLYVGDFGNNLGNRTDLRIYKVNKNDLGNNFVNAGIINFSYSDQTDFTPSQNTNNYDCEAMIFHNGNLHLFSKNWEDNKTKHYILPSTPGTYIANLQETYNVNGLITAADINEEGYLVLLGYTQTGFNFMWLVYDFAGDMFFSGNKRRIELGTSFSNAQPEGIVYTGVETGYICAEEFGSLKARIMSFDLDGLITENAVSNPIASIHLKAAPNPFSNYAQISFEQHQQEESIGQLYTTDGKLIREFELGKQQNFNVDGSDLKPGSYLLKIIQDDGEVGLIHLMKQ